ncbi:hypothetical protein GVAV_003295 [Gurleya vavrai]
MSEINFRKSFPFINTTAFSENNVPLPVSNDEYILYYNPSAKFSLVLGNGAPAYTSRYNSYKGFLFLTNYRVIYRPFQITKFFESFFVPYSDILCVEKESYFEIKVNDDYASNVYINCEDSQLNVFYEALDKMLKEYATSEKASNSGKKDVLPLYCEVYNKKKE